MCRSRGRFELLKSGVVKDRIISDCVRLKLFFSVQGPTYDAKSRSNSCAVNTRRNLIGESAT